MGRKSAGKRARRVSGPEYTPAAAGPAGKGPGKGITMARRSAMIIAAATFLMGFLAGAGFAIYNSGPSPGGASTASTGIDYAARAKMLETEVARNPQNTQAWIQLGHVYFDTGRHARAIDAYRKALALKPDNADVLTDLGIMYRRSGQPQRAVETFDRAVAVDPRHETARLNKGIVLLHDLGDREGAIRTWEALLEINPLAMASADQSVDQMIRHYREGHDRKGATR